MTYSTGIFQITYNSALYIFNHCIWYFGGVKRYKSLYTQVFDHARILENVQNSSDYTQEKSSAVEMADYHLDAENTLWNQVVYKRPFFPGVLHAWPRLRDDRLLRATLRRDAFLSLLELRVEALLPVESPSRTMLS